MIGRSVPSCALSASTLSCGANGPRIVRPTSFGSTFAMMNTMVASSQSVTSDRSRRREMNRAIGYLSPGCRRSREARWDPDLAWFDRRWFDLVSRLGVLGRGREEHLAEGAGVDTREGVHVARQVVVEVRQADR